MRRKKKKVIMLYSSSVFKIRYKLRMRDIMEAHMIRGFKREMQSKEKEEKVTLWFCIMAKLYRELLSLLGYEYTAIEC